MIDLSNMFDPARIALDIRVSSKRQLFGIAAELLACEGHGAAEILTALFDRERLGTTGVGSGIALPHARVHGLTHMRGAFLRLNDPIPFDATDGNPVDLACVLLADDSANADHLKALSRLSRVLRDDHLTQVLRSEPQPSRIVDILTSKPERSAA